jgi:hypothetical protein
MLNAGLEIPEAKVVDSQLPSFRMQARVPVDSQCLEPRRIASSTVKLEVYRDGGSTTVREKSDVEIWR